MPCIAHKSSLGRFGRSRHSCIRVWSGCISSRRGSLAVGVRCSSAGTLTTLTILIIFSVQHSVAFVDPSSYVDRNNIADFRVLVVVVLP
jgi:hypothetical protein